MDLRNLGNRGYAGRALHPSSWKPDPSVQDAGWPRKGGRSAPFQILGDFSQRVLYDASTLMGAFPVKAPQQAGREAWLLWKQPGGDAALDLA
jgi:hypothetical protein